MFLIFRLPFFKIDGLSRKSITAFFLIKVVAGLALFFLYTYFYTDRKTADIFKYYDDSKILFDTFFTNPEHFFRMLFGIDNNTSEFTGYYTSMNNWYREYESNLYNDSHTIIRINAVLRFFSFGCFNVHTVFMSFFSLLGLTAIYKTFRIIIRDKKNMLAIAVFLVPSVVFWGSGVLKESILIFGLGFLFWFYHKLFLIRFSWISLAWVIISLILLRFTKFYILVAVLPGFIANTWLMLTAYRKPILKYAVVLILYVISAFGIHYLLPEYSPFDILYIKQKDFINLSLFMQSGSFIQPPSLDNGLISFFIGIPLALFNCVFRPFFFESTNPFILLAGIENFFIILLIIISIVFSSKSKPNAMIFLFSLSFVLLLFTLIGMVTPVMGAIVRYKVPALPFLISALVMIINKEKLIAFFPVLKKLKKIKL
ncbi:MAG: hypothetical protein V2A54_15945 [Bacteroidota bacterium]